MKRKPLIAVALCMPLLMGQDAGCDDQPMPTVRQVELYVPSSIRKCAGWPASPGGGASARVTAAWLIRARDAYLSCGGNLAAVDRLISKYEAEVRRINKYR